MTVSYILVDIVCLLHVPDTLVAILREVYHKGWIYKVINIQYFEFPDYVGGILYV
jgi:hypothetical protein